MQDEETIKLSKIFDLRHCNTKNAKDAKELKWAILDDNETINWNDIDFDVRKAQWKNTHANL